MVEIRSEVELREWLIGKPADWVRGLAVRNSLRGIPLIPDPARRSRVALSNLRAAFTSWVALRYPEKELAATAVDAAYGTSGMSFQADKPLTVEVVTYAIFQAAVCISNPSDQLLDIAHAMGLLSDDYSNRGLDYWRQIEEDLEWLEVNSDDLKLLAKFLSRPLWGRQNYKFVEKYWMEFKTALLRDSQDWFPWIEWYNLRMKGAKKTFDLPLKFDENFSVSLAICKHKFWNRTAYYVNKDIINILENFKDRDELLEIRNINIPDQKLAPLMTFAREGRVAKIIPLPLAPIDQEHEQLRRQGHRAMVQAIDDFEASGMALNHPGLGLAIKRLAAALGTNVDAMDVVAAGTVAERIQQYALRANAIFMDETAAEVVALNVNVGRNLAQFPEWRRYAGIVETEMVSDNQRLAVEINVALQIVTSSALEEETAAALKALTDQAADTGGEAATIIEQAGFERALSNVLASAAEDAVKNHKKNYVKDAGNAAYDGHMDGIKDGTKNLTGQMIAGAAAGLSALAAYAAWHWLLPVLVYLGTQIPRP